MGKSWKNTIRRRIAALLVCSMAAAQLGAAAPVFAGAGDQAGSDGEELLTLRGRIVSMADGYRPGRDIDLQLYVNGRLDPGRKPVIVRAEDTREDLSPYDDSIELINDLDGTDEGGKATGSDAEGYDVWEYRFEGLPFEDKDGNEYEYTIRDAAYSPASPSNAASSSNLASSSHAAKNADALFWTNMEGTRVLQSGDVEFPAAGARLVYVPYMDLEGTYVYEEGNTDAAGAAGNGTAGKEAMAGAENVTLELGCAREEDEEFLSGCGDVELDTVHGTWRVGHVLAYNPLTCLPISAYVDAAPGGEDCRISYENRGRYVGREDHAFDGGIIRHGKIEGIKGTYRVEGTILWEDRDDLWGLRPEGAVFLRIYDGENNDVTGQMEVLAESEGQDSWNYTVDGLTAGEKYTLKQVLPAYDAESLGGSQGTLDLPAAEDGITANAPVLTERLRTRTVRGTICWDSYNPAVQDIRFPDFLRVYEGSDDVTGRVRLELVSRSMDEKQRDIWAYTLAGLPEAREYTVRAEQSTGYAVFPSEAKVEAGVGRYLQRSSTAGILEPFYMRSNEPAVLTVRNVYYDGGKPAQESISFAYSLKTGAAGGNLTDFIGDYTVVKAGSVIRTGNTDDGTISLAPGEAAKITLTVGTSYQVGQTGGNENVACLYDNENMKTQAGRLDSNKGKEVSFTNIKMQVLTYLKRWNDNGNQNGAGKRPEKETEFGSYLNVVVKRSGKVLGDAEIKKLGLGSATPEFLGEEVNEWKLSYKDLPVTDGKGKPLTYELQEGKDGIKGIPGYKEEYVKPESGSADGIYEGVITNTSYTEFTAFKRWLDDGNRKNVRYSIEKLRGRLELYRKGTGDAEVISMSSVPGEEGFLSIVQNADDGDLWDISIKNLVEYDKTGLPYTYWLVEKTDEGGVLDVPGMDGTVYYVPAYQNSDNYFNEKEKCYTGGTILNKLEGTMNFTFTKVWKDGKAAIKDSPELTFQLMRYPANLAKEEGYKTASSIETMKYTKQEDGEQRHEFEWVESGKTLLPRFNAEGVEYVYFARELLGGTNSGEYVQELSGVGGKEAFFKDLNLPLIADGETITNKRKGTQDIAVEKTWKTAAYQNVDARVILEVNWESTNPDAVPKSGTVDYDPGKEPVIDGFSAETLTMGTTVPGLEKYDGEGYLYLYTVGEKEVQMRTEQTKAAHAKDPSKPDYVKLYKGLWDDRPAFKTTQNHFDKVQYKFVEETRPDGTIINKLQDNIQIKVDKIWPDGWRPSSGKAPAKPEKLTFTLYQNGREVGKETVSGEQIDPSKERQITICTFKNVDGTFEWPRYDENGKEYIYTVTEEVTGNVGRITYSYEWEWGKWTGPADKEDDVKRVTVTNPPPGIGTGITVKKEWLDGGDLIHRGPVTVELYKKNDKGIWEAQKGKTATLTEGQGWEGYIGLDGEASGIAWEDYLVVESSIQPEGAGKPYQVKYTPEGSSPFSVDATGTHDIGANEVVGSAETNSHLYDVMNTLTWANGGAVCTIRNRRRGTVDVTVTKEWKDGVSEGAASPDGDVTGGQRPLNATFELFRNGISYKAGLDSGAVQNPQTTGTNKSQATGDSNPLIQWKGLPKYDDQGELFTYTVKETKIGDKNLEGGGVDFTEPDGVKKHHYASSVTGGAYVHTGSPAESDTIPFHAVNKRQEGRTIRIYKVWMDDGAVVDGKLVRADVNFLLKRSVDGVNLEDASEAGKAIMVDSYAPPSGHEGFWFQYEFDSAPRYDAEGREYTYYMQEGLYGNSSKYKAYYYGMEPEKIKAAEPPAGSGSEFWCPLPADTGTVVNIREDEVAVNGRKIWKNMGGLKNEDFPEVTLRLQSRMLQDTDAPYIDVKKDESGFYECTLSPKSNYEYEFKNSQPGSDGKFPKYDRKTGEELTYYVKETKVGDIEIGPDESLFERTSDKRHLILENTYVNNGKYKVKLTKTWKDVPEGKEGPEITVELWRKMVGKNPDGSDRTLDYTAQKAASKTVKYSEGVETGGNTVNTVTFENLQRIAPTGQPYVYYLKESSVGGYSSSLAVAADGTLEGTGFSLAGDETSENAQGITNTYEPEIDAHGAIKEISGIKTWPSDEASYGLRPDLEIGDLDGKITLALYRSWTEEGKDTSEEVKGASAEWTAAGKANATWVYKFTPAAGTQFAKYAPNGKEYRYYVKETIVDEDLKKIYGNGNESGKKTTAEITQNSSAINVVNNLQTVTLSSTKTWDDSKNLYGTRPESITLTVQRRPADSAGDGGWEDYKIQAAGVEKPVTLTIGASQADKWNGSIKLPKYAYNSAGKAILYAYRAVESDVPKGYICSTNGDTAGSSAGSSNQGYTSNIKNELNKKGGDATTSIKAIKKWEDEDDSDGFRDKAEVTFVLWRRPENQSTEWREVTSWKLNNKENVPEGMTVDVDGNSVTWDQLPKYMPGNESQEAEYAVSERMNLWGGKYYVPSYGSGTDGERGEPDAAGTVEITNTHVPVSDIEVTFEKKWEDSDDKWKLRPGSIGVVLMRKQKDPSTGKFGEGEPAKDKDGNLLMRIVSADSGWKATFKNLPYAKNKIPYTYYVAEGAIEDGKLVPSKIHGYQEPSAVDITEFTPIVSETATIRSGSVSVTNRLDTVSAAAGKAWAEDTVHPYGPENGTRPASVTFALYRKAGEGAYGPVDKGLCPDITITALDFSNGAAVQGSPNFRLKYEDLPKTDEKGNPYVYQIREISMSFSGIADPVSVPWNEDGTPAVGTVGGYKVSNKVSGDRKGTQTITNTLDIAGSIRVEKVWDDREDQDGLRVTDPSDIKVRLYRSSGRPEGNPSDMDLFGEKELSGGSPWYAEWENLPAQDPAGSLYYYKAVEVLPDNSAYTVSYQSEGNEAGPEGITVRPENGKAVKVTVANHYTPKTMKIMAKKEWVGDGDGIVSGRPEQITLELYRRTDSGKEPEHMAALDKTVSAGNGWSASWEDLPVCAGGDKYTYFVKEADPVPGYRTAYANDGVVTAGDTYIAAGVSGNTAEPANEGGNNKTVTVRNTWATRTVYAKKAWEDEEDRDGRREDIRLRLLANGSAAAGCEVKDLAAGAGNSVVSWEGLPAVDDSGMEISYSVEEAEVPSGYTVAYAGDSGILAGDAAHNGVSEESPLLVTNTHIPERTSYTVEKLWLGDEGWEDEVRPDEIRLQLYMTDASGIGRPMGDEAIVRPDPVTGKWTHTWTDLYKYQDGGKEIRYYVKETGTEGYSLTASGSNALVNRMLTTSLRVAKTWDDMDDEYGRRPARITVRLQRKTRDSLNWETLPEAKANAVLEARDGWGAVEFTGLPTHDKQGRPYEYRAVESKIGEEDAADGRLTGETAAGYEADYEYLANAGAAPGETRIINRLACGSLEVAKTLNGGGNDEFSFQVELAVDGEAGVYTGPYRIAEKGGDIKNGELRQTGPDGTAAIRGGEKFCIEKIPAGASYTIRELEKSGYRQESKTGDTGIIEAGKTANAEFTNRRNSGGGGGGGTPAPKPDPSSPESGGPGVAPETPALPEGPGAEEPTETLETLPEIGSLPEIPVTPEMTPDLPPDTIVEIRDPSTPLGRPLYHGPYGRGDGFKDIPSGRYELITVDDNGVPLAGLFVFIDDEGVPLGLPKTGDTRIPMALLAAALVGAAAGLLMMGRRKKKEQE